MKTVLGALLLWAGCLLAMPSPAAQFDLAAVSCDKYENEIVGSADASQSPAQAASSAAPETPRPDAIDTVMWLFGFSVAAAGDHTMYGDALAPFGFALDAECKNHPTASLLEAVGTVKPNRDKPMDLTVLNCGDFESRHAESARSDPESANTIMMWLFGFSVGLSRSHVFDSAGVGPFAAALKARCATNPNDSLFQSLSAVARPPRAEHHGRPSGTAPAH